ncbi:MAG: hypothetical protein KJO36_06100 [Acidimicrobiia bacterium]|nr:hypothetical protein [Acidimicrobiia bacterium]
MLTSCSRVQSDGWVQPCNNLDGIRIRYRKLKEWALRPPGAVVLSGLFRGADSKVGIVGRFRVAEGKDATAARR